VPSAPPVFIERALSCRHISLSLPFCSRPGLGDPVLIQETHPLANNCPLGVRSLGERLKVESTDPEVADSLAVLPSEGQVAAGCRCAASMVEIGTGSAITSESFSASVKGAADGGGD